jgi:hypothetical protein
MHNIKLLQRRSIFTMSEKFKMNFIKGTYWFGIIADALWVAGLVSPKVFGFLTGAPDFDPDIQVRLIMGIGASLMTGWTALLIWALQKPVERRGVLLLTACPVVTGLFFVALIGLQDGSSANLLLVIKTILLFITMTTSYFLAGKLEKQGAA